MAKVIFIDNNGNEKILRESDNLYEGDVLFRKDYFATKLWCRDDIEKQFSELGYDFSQDDVDDVLLEGGKWNGLNDCNDNDWGCINDIIRDVMRKKSQSVTRIEVRDISWGDAEEENELPIEVVIKAEELSDEEREKLFEEDEREFIITAWLEAEYGFTPDGFNTALY